MLPFDLLHVICLFCQGQRPQNFCPWALASVCTYAPLSLKVTFIVRLILGIDIDWYVVRLCRIAHGRRDFQVENHQHEMSQTEYLQGASCSVVKSNELKQNPQQQHYYEWNQ